MLESLHIVRYTAEQNGVWDDFVVKAKNGTFLFMRDYMDYHADRFVDYSLMFYKGKQLLALLPAHIAGKVFGTHAGLTYGGFLISYQVTADVMIEMFRMLCRYLKENTEADKILYRVIPYIYHAYPSEEDLYALFRLEARLTERKISSVVLLSAGIPFRKLRVRKLKQAQKGGVTICSDSAYELFWPILERNLLECHGANPVHSLEEITCLHSRFPENIRLHRAVNEEKETLAGCVMYITDNVAHVQYIGSTEQGRKQGALDLLFDKLLHEHYIDKKYFDFGTSVENGGRYLNEGLIFQKEGFGGRAVVYDVYELCLNSISDD
ncbi:GNAT family N-acetyltransferase [Bacteroides salyersiae]|uniref:GNAT family N-acetyltransferase n=1 Tax=Bacteroides salyersiae TaxID=291644 RepID=UPI001C8B613C|nr:GNAT family N-acetyltransferase [Bacteroides salyersiae]